MRIMILSFLALSFNSYAQDILLNQNEMTLPSNSVVLEKTNASPNFIVLNIPVPTTQNICVQYDERQTYGPNGAQCGYDTVQRQDCSYGGMYPGSGGRVVRRGPIGGGRVVRRGPVGGGRVVRRGPIGGPIGRGYPATRCRIYTENVPRSCYFTESFCAQFDSQVTNVYKKFNLEFQKFDRDARINFSLDENNNLNVDVLSVSESCIKKTVYASGGVVTGVKLKLKSRCR